MIPLSNPILGELERDSLLRCLETGFVSSVGPLVPEFERAFAAKVGAKYAVATSTGTAAIHAALHALGIGAGDAVAVQDLTFVASMNPVLYCGAQPVLIDVERATWGLDAAVLRDVCVQARRQGRARIRAVIPVHLYGCCCDMQALREVAEEFELLIVEDATEALGTQWRGRQVGTLGDIGCFSFNGNKMITTGSGGMVVTDSKERADKVRYFVNQARDDAEYYRHDAMGFNYRMNSLSAALGLAQMQRLDGLVEAKRAIAGRYRQGLAGIAGIQLPPEPDGVTNCFWLYGIVLQNVARRDAWIRLLRDAEVTARPFFEPLHTQAYVKQPVWRMGSRGAEESPSGVSTELSAGGINLPSSADLTEADQARVIAALCRAAAEEACNNPIREERTLAGS